MLGRLPNPNKFPAAAYDPLLGTQLLSRLQALPIDRRWDAVLFDEAHTFDQSWLPCCVAALRDRGDGDLLIVSDRNQGLYKTRVTWHCI